jgi:hypothetical protein
MRTIIGWLCYRIVMAWPHPLPHCGKNRAFAWLLARAGEYATSTPNVLGNRRCAASSRSVRVDRRVGRRCVRKPPDT